MCAQQIDDSFDDEFPDASRGVLYPDARAGLVRAVRDMLAAPFAPVTFWHVIVADYATSLAKALGDFQVTVCVAAEALRAGNLQSSDELYDHHKQSCTKSIFNAAALALPFWCRLAQCIHVYAETGDRKNLINALKYFSAFPLVVASYFQKHGPVDPVVRGIPNVLICAAMLNSSFSFVWDIIMDWGLLRPKRRAIVLGSMPPKSIVPTYMLLLAFNLIMRFTWAVAVFSHASHSTQNIRMFVLEAAEVARRTVRHFAYLSGRVQGTLNFEKSWPRRCGPSSGSNWSTLRRACQLCPFLKKPFNSLPEAATAPVTRIHSFTETTCIEALRIATRPLYKECHMQLARQPPTDMR